MVVTKGSEVDGGMKLEGHEILGGSDGGASDWAGATIYISLSICESFASTDDPACTQYLIQNILCLQISLI